MRRGPFRPQLYIVKEDGEQALRLWALSFLIQDRSDQTPSYAQYLTQIKEKVRLLNFQSGNDLTKFFLHRSMEAAILERL